MSISVEFVKPNEIEKRSMEIIESELLMQVGQEILEGIESEQLPIVKRVIHTTADFDYAKNLVFSKEVVSILRKHISEGGLIVTDTRMAFSGINKKRLAEYGSEVVCYMDDPQVAEEAIKRGQTRATVSMERALGLGRRVLFVVGNAPTALIAIREAVDAGIAGDNIAGVIGVPVGFVNVEAAKELIIETDLPYIVARGRKGGSNVAAAIVNALVYGI